MTVAPRQRPASCSTTTSPALRATLPIRHSPVTCRQRAIITPPWLTTTTSFPGAPAATRSSAAPARAATSTSVSPPGRRPGQRGELGLVLLGERGPLCDRAREQDVGELARQAVDQLLGKCAVQADHELAPDRARGVVDAVEARDLLDRLVDRGGHLEERHVLRRDEMLAQQVLLDVALPRLPVRAARRVHEHDRHELRLAGLHERQALVGLVVRAEAAREEGRRVRLLHEDELTGEEVAEGGELRVLADDLVRLLLEGEPDVDPEAPLAPRALLAGAHDAAARAGDDHVAVRD